MKNEKLLVVKVAAKLALVALLAFGLFQLMIY